MGGGMGDGQAAPFFGLDDLYVFLHGFAIRGVGYDVLPVLLAVKRPIERLPLERHNHVV